MRVFGSGPNLGFGDARAMSHQKKSLREVIDEIDSATENNLSASDALIVCALRDILKRLNDVEDRVEGVDASFENYKRFST